MHYHEFHRAKTQLVLSSCFVEPVEVDAGSNNEFGGGWRFCVPSFVVVPTGIIGAIVLSGVSLF